jgi:CRISPR-associated protein Csd1
MLAVLEEVQRAAIPGAKATLVDKFYGTACSAPATVFGTLMRNAQAHLGKLRKTREAAYYALQNRLGEIASLMPESGFPSILSLQDQALFGLGYYQQKAADRAARRAAGQAEDETESDN